MESKTERTLPDWEGLHRIVPSHFPPIDLFESVYEPGELDVAFEIESLTNDRLKDEVGSLRLVPEEDRVSGPGSTPVMAAFTHIGVASRFTDGRYGVYYGAKDLDTAIAETVYHRERLLSDTNEPDVEITMRQYVNRIALPLDDVRGSEFEFLHDPDDYSESQKFAALKREQSSHGFVYNSVRDPGGQCVAAFRPTAVTIPIQGCHFRYVWSGFHQKIVSVLKVSEFHTEQ